MRNESKIVLKFHKRLKIISPNIERVLKSTELVRKFFHGQVFAKKGNQRLLYFLKYKGHSE